MRWREEDEEPCSKEKIYAAYKDWCNEDTKNCIFENTRDFFIDIIAHLVELGFKKEDIETEDKLYLKEFTV